MAKAEVDEIFMYSRSKILLLIKYMLSLALLDSTTLAAAKKSALRQTAHDRPTLPMITTPTCSHLAQLANWLDLVREGLSSQARAADRLTSLCKPCQQPVVGTWLWTRRTLWKSVSTAPLDGWRISSTIIAVTMKSREMRKGLH